LQDPGLSEAIEAVGGVTELARRIGIAQPSVSNWDRVPADRVIAVETATGISRMRLRPDLFDKDFVSGGVDDVESDRAQEYVLLSLLLARAPTKALLTRLAQLRGDATPLGLAHAALAQAAGDADVGQVEREYFDLLIGVGRGEILPYASYYLTGFLHERPLARLRDDLAQLGIERVDSNHEPEDHAATLCEIMAGLARGDFPAPEYADRNLFEKHIAPWMGRMFADMERVDGMKFYRHVGALGRVFLDIETEAFALAD
jgi:TorA maturation chaperone TorD/DNA-binding transcriptional regulator YdaS (Cro superfamily)